MISFSCTLKDDCKSTTLSFEKAGQRKRVSRDAAAELTDIIIISAARFKFLNITCRKLRSAFTYYKYAFKRVHALNGLYFHCIIITSFTF